MSRVLIISNDYVSKRMAGPAIRCFNLSEVLSRRHEVKLACENEPDIEARGFSLVPFKRDPESLRALAAESNVVVLPPYTLAIYPFLKDLGVPLVMDLYDPFILEKLEVYQGGGTREQFQSDLNVLKDLLIAGDFFIAGTEDQRSFWLGMLASLGRINPRTYISDKSLNNLICTIPFGVSSKPPVHSTQVLKGVVKGIERDDFVLLWAGGIWNWFDPFTLIRAMGRVNDPAIKLFFLGVKHPHPAMPKEQFRVAGEAKELAEKLGLLNKSVFFNHEWVPFEMRQNFLLEADAGVSTHFDHVENRFSIRTRALDYIWAGLPMVMTAGDYISRLVEERDVGITIPQENDEALADAIVRLKNADRTAIQSYKKRLTQLAQEFRWDVIVRPLDEYCLAPRLAADKADPLSSDEAIPQIVDDPEGSTAKRRSIPEKVLNLLKNLLIK
ncbi:MAG: glycosyltransferase family 4 protein [Candidatus Coatesbacteria bacterium]|nr:glycosyltransferase family 4 protein [Candidatus Coatesbacteria bacterium]